MRMHSRGYGMSLFAKKEQVFGPEQISVGDFDVTVDGCYRNVVPVPFDLKPHRMLYVRIDSAHPVNVVVAREDRSSVLHKEGVTHAVLGPFDTGRSRSMGIILGVDKGDRAVVAVEAWTDRERSV